MERYIRKIIKLCSHLTLQCRYSVECMCLQTVSSVLELGNYHTV